ncbi:hypothetical protein OEZ86_009492 [Tetradesmus obliquus]|uniref:Uncharacterized protein n=1 Tax=Tetradesmus obliquus TaxID=3088 RepID=A0ABY8UMB7_TETOB|nr:hypothetical protein OEZ85_000939 [Tetradesmus obliquus]WIA42950.1 hypothetical protein OEZ86_009492 [Tetradesmus obliquus]
MAMETAATQAVSDMMSYTVVRVLTHCVHVATPQQKLAWIEAGAIAKARCVQQALQHASATMRAGGGMDTLLQHLVPVWHAHARAEALKHSREVTAVAKAEAEQGRLLGNAAYKAGQLQEALNFYRAAARAHPGDHLLYNNISLVQLKMGHVTEAYAAALAALGHCPSNAKAWLRLAEACKAAGRWQLAQLYYSMAVEELGVTDEAAQQSMLESCAHLSRVWRWAEVSVAWQLDALAKWLRMPAKPNTEAGIAAWSQQLNDDWFRLSIFNSSRAMAVAHKNEVLAAQALRAAEAGQLRRLPLSGHTWRLSWRQMDIRGLSSGHAKYEISLVLESTTWELTTLVEGQPCAADLLALTALQCWAPVQAGARHRPKQLLLAARCKALFAELADVVATKWGIPLTLETDVEAQRRAKEDGSHHLGLQESFVASRSSGASEAEALQGFKLECNRIQLEEGEQDEGCDHKGTGSSSSSSSSSGSNGTSSAQQPRAAAGSRSSSSNRSQSTNSRSAGQQQTRQQQPPELQGDTVAGSSSTERSSVVGAGWPALLAAVRAGKPTALEVDELTTRLQEL